MKKQKLSIVVHDLRYPEDDDRRTTVHTFSRHTEYLRQMGRLQRDHQLGGRDVSEETRTVLTVYPRTQKTLL